MMNLLMKDSEVNHGEIDNYITAESSFIGR